MRTISDSHDGLDKPANLNGVHAKMIRAHKLPADPLLFDDGERIGPRAELAVRYAPEKCGFPDGAHEFYCKPHAQATEGGGGFGFLMTRAIGSVKKKNLGNKPRHRPISCS